jgi:hypothetical protein
MFLIWFIAIIVANPHPGKVDKHNPGHYIKGVEWTVKCGKAMQIYSECTASGAVDPNRHRVIRCMNHDETKTVYCLKTWEYRPDGNTNYDHRCQNLIPEEGRRLLIPADPNVLSGNLEIQQLRRKYHKWIACAAVSFQGATCTEFYDWLYSTLDAYKKSEYDSPDEFWKMQGRKELSNAFSAEGRILLSNWMESLEGEHVSFVLDAYTLHHRHLIAALLVTPQLERPPLLVYLVQASNEQESYAKAGLFCEMLVRFSYNVHCLIVLRT